MPGKDLLVAVYGSHAAAEEGLRTLDRSGVAMRNISIVGRDYHSEEQPIGYFNLGDRVRFFGKYGAFWGTLAGVLLGSFVMFIPVFGHLIILGPLAASIISGAQGAVIGGGTGALVGALTAIGVPRDTAIRYETQLKADKFLLLVHSKGFDADRVKALLEGSGAESVAAHEGS